MPRKTDSRNPADWLWIAHSELEMVRLPIEHEISVIACRARIAEILEKVVKAELIRVGWPLEKTHDLNRLGDALDEFGSPFAATAIPLCHAFVGVYFTDRYPGFDLDDPDWPVLRAQVEQLSALPAAVQVRLPAK